MAEEVTKARGGQDLGSIPAEGLGQGREGWAMTTPTTRTHRALG